MSFYDVYTFVRIHIMYNTFQILNKRAKFHTYVNYDSRPADLPVILIYNRSSNAKKTTACACGSHAFIIVRHSAINNNFACDKNRQYYFIFDFFLWNYKIILIIAIVLKAKGYVGHSKGPMHTSSQRRGAAELLKISNISECAACGSICRLI